MKPVKFPRDRSVTQALLLPLALLAAVSACQSPEGGAQDLAPLPDVSDRDPPNTNVDPPASSYGTDVLLFNGTGVSTSDWQNTEKIVKSQGWTYRLANSAQLNAMSLDEISNHGVLIVPGGKGGTITSNLTTATRLRVRQAVRDRGMGYVGFCAGAWVAVGPEADTDSVASYGMAVAEGAVLPSYFPGGNTSLVAAMVPVTFADRSQRMLVWWGGPSTPEWKDGVVARYVNGKPAISETWSGKGYVVISGPHPEAPQAWRSSAGFDSDGLDYDIAIDMVQAALKKQPLPSY